MLGYSASGNRYGRPAPRGRLPRDRAHRRRHIAYRGAVHEMHAVAERHAERDTGRGQRHAPRAAARRRAAEPGSFANNICQAPPYAWTFGTSRRDCRFDRTFTAPAPAVKDASLVALERMGIVMDATATFEGGVGLQGLSVP